MPYQNADIDRVAEELKARAGDGPALLRAPELKALFDLLKTLPPEQRSSFGQELNQLKQELTEMMKNGSESEVKLEPIDVTAPFDINTAEKRPKFLPTETGSKHPLMTELNKVYDIFGRMGFDAVESRELDDEYHMFTSLNFPADHPARDDYDTFMTVEKAQDGQAYVAPAHVSIMQNRLLKRFKSNLENGQPISTVYAGRTFRNEDVDARHEHTFYQVEIMYIDKGINVGNLISTLKTFLEEYFGQKLEIKTQPFYFPFTEPSFEFALSCPFCKKVGCNICSYTGWIELLGCGLVNPEVLRMGGVDPDIYTGFAAGMGLDRLVMMKNDIEDVRHFESGKLEFLRQFS
jgi:phenylalanyl-tRNA synthetase alpha chain